MFEVIGKTLHRYVSIKKRVAIGIATSDGATYRKSLIRPTRSPRRAN